MLEVFLNFPILMYPLNILESKFVSTVEFLFNEGLQLEDFNEEIAKYS